jgi:uncharacterized membrane protein
MPAIERTLLIQADPAAVFDLISRVEDFSRYSRVIKKVTAIGPNRYRWVIGVAGLELSWDSEVTETRRPRRFAWRAIRGVENYGAFHLKPADGGTEICFTMEYRLANPILEKIVQAVAIPLMQKVAAEILEQVRRRLEASC